MFIFQLQSESIVYHLLGSKREKEKRSGNPINSITET